MNAVTSPHTSALAPLAAQDEAIDHYLAGLLTEAAAPLPAPTPNRAPIPFVRAELYSAQEVADVTDWVNESLPATAERAPMDYAVAANAWSDPLALELPNEPSPALPVQQPEWQVPEAPLIPTAQCQEQAPADPVASTELLPEVSPELEFERESERESEFAPAIAPDLPPEIQAERTASTLTDWQYFQMGALTVALPKGEIHTVLTAPSLKPVQGAPAAVGGAVAHQARWLPVVSMAGFLPTPTGAPVVALLGGQGLWGVVLGVEVAAPETAVWDAVQWRSEADTATDRPWLLGIQPAARLVVLNAPALRRLLDGNK